MRFYDDWAQRILRGELTDHLAFYGLPLYAYLLAFIYRIVGYNPFVPGLLQAILDGATALLIYIITLRVFGRGRIPGQVKLIGLIAALAWAFFVPAQAYAAILMPTTWFVFVFWFVVWRIVRSDHAPSATECLLLGLLVGITAMGIATILFLLPLILSALFIKPKIDSRPSRLSIVASAGLALAGVGLGTSPCWIHNYFVARDPVFLSAHSGINFWIGNNPAANGYPRFPPGLRAGQAAMLEDSIVAAETAAGHPLKRSEVSAFWSRKARDYIKNNFGAWLRLLSIKLQNSWNAFQYDDLSIITSLREQRIVLPGLYFGVIAALGIPGLILAWRSVPQSRWITIAILLHMVALLPVFVTERYRLAVVPGLLLFAAFGLSVLWKSCALGNYRHLAAYGILVVGSTLFVSLPKRDPSLWALDAYNSGWQALESNDLVLAEKKLGIAYAYVPENSETNFALGNLRLAQGNPASAKSFYRAALQLYPNHKGAFNNLGVIAFDQNEFVESEQWLRHALIVDPRNAKTHFLLARTLFRKGDRASALVEAQRAADLSPTQREFVALRNEIENSERY
jgi:tetratricopeptide (TPR) repeat protein